MRLCLVLLATWRVVAWSLIILASQLCVLYVEEVLHLNMRQHMLLKLLVYAGTASFCFLRILLHLLKTLDDQLEEEGIGKAVPNRLKIFSHNNSHI